MKLLKKKYLFVGVLVLSMVLILTNVGLAIDLIFAVRDNNIEEVKTLIKNGVDVNNKYSRFYNRTALISAAADAEGFLEAEGSLEISEFLIENGANVNAKDDYGWTALMYAAENGYYEITKLLIENGANVNAKKDNYGWTALMKAIENGSSEITKLLIENGADIHEKNKRGITVLMYAAVHESSEITKLLIENGANVNAKKDNYGWTALMKAIENGSSEITKLLIENGADIHAKDKKGRTALMLVSNKETAELLIENGADIHAKDKKGNTALMHAAKDGSYEITKLLIENGANVNAKDEDGTTVLMDAAMGDNPEVVDMLIKNGVKDINAKKEWGKTALMMASGCYSTNGNPRIVEILIENGADVNLKDSSGETALMHASEQKNHKIAGILAENNAEGNTIKRENLKDEIYYLSGTLERIELLLVESRTNYYYLSKYPITGGQYKAIMGYDPSEDSYGNKNSDYNAPVTSVTWFEAVLFCNKLSEEEGLEKYYKISDIGKNLLGSHIVSATVETNDKANGFRLPSKREWLYAAEGGKKGKSTTYAGSNNIDEVAWYSDNSYGHKHAVGEKKPNELGFYDMSGNVSEWLSDYNSTNKSKRYTIGGSFFDGKNKIKLDNSTSKKVGAGFDEFNRGFRIMKPVIKSVI